MMLTGEKTNGHEDSVRIFFKKGDEFEIDYAPVIATTDVEIVTTGIVYHTDPMMIEIKEIIGNYKRDGEQDIAAASNQELLSEYYILASTEELDGGGEEEDYEKRLQAEILRRMSEGHKDG